MQVSARISSAGRVADTWTTHITAALLFLAANALGYVLAGGLDFVQQWGGGIAATIATGYLVWKLQGYWVWMVVNAALWAALFFHFGLPMLAWLQIAIVGFSVYGAVQWALVTLRIGYRSDVVSDNVGLVLSLGLFAYSVYAYSHMPGYSLSTWWWVEFGSVLTAVVAIAMDAYRYKANWIAWTLSNLFSWPLFWHTSLWGPFVMNFAYQSINVVGYYHWRQEEARLRRAPAVAIAASGGSS
jgi:hypothetical protein